MSSSFDWNQFKPVDQASASQPQSQGATNTYYWNQFETVQQQKKPSFLQEAGRHIARSASRVGETLLGLPGDIVRFPETVG